jgi:hypothetical protein
MRVTMETATNAKNVRRIAGTCGKPIERGMYIARRRDVCGPAEEGDILCGLAIENFAEGDSVYIDPVTGRAFRTE